jgi:hypothetical protein
LIFSCARDFYSFSLIILWASSILTVASDSSFYFANYSAIFLSSLFLITSYSAASLAFFSFYACSNALILAYVSSAIFY